jgi:hypothetical protein
LKSTCQQKLRLNLKQLKFEFSKWLRKKKNHQHESFRYLKVMKLYS